MTSSVSSSTSSTGTTGTTSTSSTSNSSTSNSNSSTSASSTSAAIAAANKAAAQALITSLGAGSGVDVTSLATNLVNAEKVPQENAINAKITANDNKVSGYSAVLYMLGQLNTALAAVKNTSDYNSLSVTGASSSYTLTPSSTAKEGDHTIAVNTTFKAQKSLSTTSFTDTTSAGQIGTGPFQITVGSGNPVTIMKSDGATPPTLSTPTTPQELADAINATSNLGVTAGLVNTGSGYKLVLTGTAGAGNGFTFSDASTSNNIGFPASNLQDATDASLTVDGIAYTRKSNSISDIIPGVKMAVKSPTTTTDYVSLARDTSALKTNFDAFVTSYNDTQSLLKEVTDPKSTLATYGGTLVGDSSVRMVQTKLRSMFSNASSTPGTNIQYMWQMGFSFDATGVLSLDATKFSDAMTNHYDDVVKAVTGNQDNLSKYSPAPAGFFGDATYKINQLTAATGPIGTQSLNATNQNTKYQDQLTQLDSRMDSLLTRYTKQFAAMNSLVGTVNSQKTSLKTTFDGMMAMYTGKSG